MGNALFKRVNRVAPRYRFSESDREIMRFTTSPHTRIFKTPIFDISESGVSFLTTAKLAPRIGEVIKMDFAPLGSMRMACLGKVVRVEEPTRSTPWARSPNTVKVGINFHDMPKAYARLLSASLQSAFTKQTRSSHYRDVTIQVRKKKTGPSWLSQNIGSVFATALLLVGCGYGVYYFLQNGPEEHSASSSMSKEAGWASNFFERINK